MNELRNRGFCFVLDDYGSGYSNLSRLQRLPFTGIKLDMEIVRAHCKDPNPVLPTLVRVFRERGLSITAEGIETDAVAEDRRGDRNRRRRGRDDGHRLRLSAGLPVFTPRPDGRVPAEISLTETPLSKEKYRQKHAAVL